MNSRSNQLRVALCQLRMNWTGDENTTSIVQQLSLASANGASICLFPELAVTGIHRRIAQAAVPELVYDWMEQVRLACIGNTIATSVGAPTFTPEGKIRISQHVLNEDGETVGVVHKRGLTAPEATFFEPGAQRPTIELVGRSWSAMICREIDDSVQIADELAHNMPEIVLWPGGLRPDPDKPRTDPPEHVRTAQTFARDCGVFVVMVNWPNALNRPEESAEAGSSVVINPAGEILLTLPKAEAGMALFTLGES
ncbi:MAG: carbon-nitrogen hydrolase family protein, partial [Desulfobulbaceae bacterium]|nr:carbon-nitrogen hydrolase family protein [Desulfobulbaceae bacterium]